MRISGGSLRGHRLTRLHGGRIRPSSEKVRQAMFNVLTTQRGGSGLASIRVIDIFAGTGVLGFEALSRGASFVLFLDQDRRALAAIRRNAASLRLRNGYDVRRRDATRVGKLPNTLAPFNLLFCDPPYDKGLGEKALASVIAGGWLADGAIVILEDAVDASFTPPPQLQILLQRRYGGSQLIWLEQKPFSQ